VPYSVRFKEELGSRKGYLQFSGFIKCEYISPLLQCSHPSAPPDRLSRAAGELLQCILVAVICYKSMIIVLQSSDNISF
jgi:hypothetical protein